MSLITLLITGAVSGLVGAIICGRNWSKEYKRLESDIRNALCVYDEGIYEVQKKVSEIYRERHIVNGVDKGTRLVLKLVPDVE